MMAQGGDWYYFSLNLNILTIKGRPIPWIINIMMTTATVRKMSVSLCGKLWPSAMSRGRAKAAAKDTMPRIPDHPITNASLLLSMSVL